MLFNIEQDKDINIYQDHLLFCKVTQKMSFFGKKTLDFYLNNQIALTTTDETTFFTRKINISYQNLPDPIQTLSASADTLILNDLSISIRRHFFENTIYTLYLSENCIGTVKTNTVLQIAPFIYDIDLNCDPNHRLYCLILVVLQLPSNLDD